MRRQTMRDIIARMMLVCPNAVREGHAGTIGELAELVMPDVDEDTQGALVNVVTSTANAHVPLDTDPDESPALAMAVLLGILWGRVMGPVPDIHAMN